MSKKPANKNPLLNLTNINFNSSKFCNDLITKVKESLSKGLIAAQKMLEY